MNISPDHAYRQRGELVTREILGETIVVPIAGELASMDDIFSLNATGAYIWSRLDGATPLQAIREGLSARFDVSRAQAEADLDELIAALVEARLAERAA